MGQMEGAFRSDVPQRIATRVSVIGRVRHFADANRVQDNQYDTPKGRHSPRASVIRAVNWSTKRSGTNPFIRL